MLRFCKVLILFFAPVAALAGGFDINLQGIRQQGMGNTGTGLLQGSSSLFYNPGAVSLLKGNFHFQGGANISAFNAVYYDPVSDITARTKDRYTFPFSVYADARVSKFMSVGMAVYNPNGVDIYWDNNWKGRFLVQNTHLQTTNFQPTVSFKLSDKLGIGAGFIYSVGTAQFTRDIPVSDASGSRSFIELSGKTTGIGLNAGVFFKPDDVWRFGFSFRKGVNYKIENGDVVITVPPSVQSFFPENTKFSGAIPGPDVYNVGFSAQLSKRFLIAGDVNYQTWSSFKRQDIDFTENTAEFEDISQPVFWKNTTSLRIGAQYLRSCCLSFRAGAAFEQSPVNRVYYFPDMADGNRFTFHAGFTYDFDDHWSVDLASMLIETKQVEGNYSPSGFRGVYKTRTVVGSFGISYVF